MLDRLKQGYAKLLDASVKHFATPGLHFVITPKRDQPEWANWVHPIWFFKIDNTVICSVSPTYATRAKQILAGVALDTLLSVELLTLVHHITEGQAVESQCAEGLEWVQCELLYYSHSHPPVLAPSYAVEQLQPIDARSRYFLRNFDGGGYAIRAEDGVIASHACIKDKGLLHEVAVGTEAAYRQQGMGKAVVAAAVAHILHQGGVPVYWPDSVQNVPSYNLAYSLGFQKAAEMLFCCYALPNWAGFPSE